MSKLIKSLLQEFVIPSSNIFSTKESVLQHLDKIVKNDEYDTVCYGLETDDDKIIKVYVDVEDSEAFEKDIANSLQKDTNLEDLINELASKYNIVDVEWPEDQEQEEQSSEVSTEKDGTEALNPNINYDDFDEDDQKNENTEVDENKPLSFGQRFAKKYLGEAVEKSVEKTEKKAKREDDSSSLPSMLRWCFTELGIPAKVKEANSVIYNKMIRELANNLLHDTEKITALRQFYTNAKRINKNAELSLSEAKDITKYLDKIDDEQEEQEKDVDKKKTESAVRRGLINSLEKKIYDTIISLGMDEKMLTGKGLTRDVILSIRSKAIEYRNTPKKLSILIALMKAFTK